MTSTATLEDRVRAALAPHLLVVRGIGTGGMGAVFLAREPALKRTVAVKVLSPDLAATPEARARFEREAQAVAGLSHPNVVPVRAPHRPGGPAGADRGRAQHDPVREGPGGVGRRVQAVRHQPFAGVVGALPARPAVLPAAGGGAGRHQLPQRVPGAYR